MYDLGNLLKHLREEKNVSMDKMIEDIKTLYSISIAKSTISKWENNKADPSMENAKILCNYFNVSLDYLLGLSKYKTKEEELEIYKSKMLEFANKHNKNLYEKTLLDNFKELNDIGKKKVITYTKDLVEMPKYQKQIWEEESKEYLMPNAAHEIEGDFTEEDYKHDDDIMKNDDFWK
ncbi:helix-turn-helix domain-containing protein [Clostridium sardiniense]|uniref:Helix-turn-helix domain-containing protein n=1 Tax=Clostridium sardiniense TaxID=29369 RepID=A0ABS7KW84_CLOSR|nr:helix-turn-helix transcriptional regulator [Clostridium sardiniense]MBY0755065.1 helix-turn-helix domain-containing protein [Clostridium sardiniense]MDQ0459077.1 transcriptional regulator with XRE-family HTH domain [Clostridium sardiniense]